MEKNFSPSKRLFIGSLPYRYTEGELLSLFIPFGKVIFIKIMHNRWGKSRGLAFVEFENLDEAIAAKTALHGYKLGDLSIIVDYAQPDPFLTPEGQARHQEALDRHPERRQREEKRFERKKAQSKDSSIKKLKKPTSFKHQRQSVYDSRTHHARVGAKFARRNKKK